MINKCFFLMYILPLSVNLSVSMLGILRSHMFSIQDDVWSACRAMQNTFVIFLHVVSILLRYTLREPLLSGHSFFTEKVAF